MFDVIGFAMDGFGLDDFAAKGLTDSLMAEADAEEGRITLGGGLDEVEANAGMVGIAGAGGDEDAFGFFREDLIDGDFVIAIDLGFDAQIAQILDQVVGKAVVIVDQRNHG